MPKNDSTTEFYLMEIDLIRKYNVNAPRYTSYPPITRWEEEQFNEAQWLDDIRSTFTLHGEQEGMSLYVHLPYCESLCTYCGCNTRITVNHKVERPYIDTVLKEWNMIVDHIGTRPLLSEIHLGGGTPTFFSPQHLALLITGILSVADLKSNASMSIEVHPHNTTKEHLYLLSTLGFTRISIGVQDLDPTVQKAIHRIQSIEEVEHTTRQARELGFSSVNYDLIYGLPFQDASCIQRTIDQVIRLKPDRIALYSYAHVPWLKPGQRGFSEEDLPRDQEKLKLYEWAQALLLKHGYVEIGMDHFALLNDELCVAQRAKRLHRNFMGYTTDNAKLSIGLGVSAISDAWIGFAQNAKSVEAYMEKINAGAWAFSKGYHLTEEDMVIRKHILRLTCNQETSWFEEEEQCDQLYVGLEKWHSLAMDGLVELYPYRLLITKKGRPFTRFICMQLDAYIGAGKFSTVV